MKYKSQNCFCENVIQLKLKLLAYQLFKHNQLQIIK